MLRTKSFTRCGATIVIVEHHLDLVANIAEHVMVLDRGAVLSSFYYHYARLIEIVYGLEKMEQLLTRRAFSTRMCGLTQLSTIPRAWVSPKRPAAP